MTHVATQIRHRIKDLLVAGTRIVEREAVYTNRVFPTSVLPCIAIYENRERIRNEGKELDGPLNAPANYSRELEVVVEVRATHPDDPSGAVDEIRTEVEALIAADQTLNGLAVEVDMLGTTRQTLSGEYPVEVASILYRIWYRTTALNPESAIS